MIEQSPGGSHISLRFIYIHFDLGWNRSVSPEKVIYKTTTNGVRLWVVTEDATGDKQTYIFRLAANLEVWVSLHENIAYVPVLPYARQPGDTTQIITTAEANQ